MGFKSIIKKIWDFLWHSNSIWSWIVDLILVFVIVKFIIFPFFSLILATPLPFVIIESHSMEHEGNFDSWFSLHGLWYLENNISKEEVMGWKWTNGMDKGDIIIVRGLKDKDYDVGDVIIFKVSEQGTPIIHRIIDKRIEQNETFFVTKGDHNDGQLEYELSVKEDQILGKAIAKIPKIGWLKLMFVRPFI